MKQPQRRFAALEEDRFGDLDFEPRGREPARRECAEDRVVRAGRGGTGPARRSPRRGSVRAMRAACAQASRITHAPIGTISPVSSATGMNSAGEIRPRSDGSSGSAPRTSRSGYARDRTAAGRTARTRRVRARPQVGFELAPLLRRWFRLSSKKRRCRGPLPWRGTARGRRSSAGSPPSSPSSGAMAMPMLVDGRGRCRRSSSAARSRAGCRARAGRPRRDPRRRSGGRRIRRRQDGRRNGRARPRRSRSAVFISSASPAGWPSVSLITLNWSRSRQCSANRPSLPSQARNNCSTCWWNMVRLGRPVSTSLKASWVMRCSRSAILPTISLKLSASRASSSRPRTRTCTCSPLASRPAASSRRASGWVMRPAARQVTKLMTMRPSRVISTNPELKLAGIGEGLRLRVGEQQDRPLAVREGRKRLGQGDRLVAGDLHLERGAARHVALGERVGLRHSAPTCSPRPPTSVRCSGRGQRHGAGSPTAARARASRERRGRPRTRPSRSGSAP